MSFTAKKKVHASKSRQSNIDISPDTSDPELSDTADLADILSSDFSLSRKDRYKDDGEYGLFQMIIHHLIQHY